METSPLAYSSGDIEQRPLAYSLEQTLKIVPFGRTTCYAEIKSGRLRAKKLNKSTIILRADLEEFLSKLASYPTQEGAK